MFPTCINRPLVGRPPVSLEKLIKLGAMSCSNMGCQARSITVLAVALHCSIHLHWWVVSLLSRCSVRCSLVDFVIPQLTSHSRPLLVTTNRPCAPYAKPTASSLMSTMLPHLAYRHATHLYVRYIILPLCIH